MIANRISQEFSFFFFFYWSNSPFLPSFFLFPSFALVMAIHFLPRHGPPLNIFESTKCKHLNPNALPFFLSRNKCTHFIYFLLKHFIIIITVQLCYYRFIPTPWPSSKRKKGKYKQREKKERKKSIQIRKGRRRKSS